jgi:hypothetical protein
MQKAGRCRSGFRDSQRYVDWTTAGEHGLAAGAGRTNQEPTSDPSASSKCNSHKVFFVLLLTVLYPSDPFKISWFTTIVFVSLSSSSFAPQAFAFTSSSSLSKPFKTVFVSHLPVFILRSPKPSVRRLSMSSAPDQSFFKDVIYNQSKETKTAVPWDIQRHQPALEKVQSMFKGNILDVGSGTGDNARWLASLPAVTSVKAVDLAPLAIQEAMSRVSGNGWCTPRVSTSQYFRTPHYCTE